MYVSQGLDIRTHKVYTKDISTPTEGDFKWQKQ